MTLSTPSLATLSARLTVSHLTSPIQVEELISTKKIVRILQPSLLEELNARMGNGRVSDPFVVFQGQIFLSLQKIRSVEERERVFYLLRDYQLGKEINMAALPHSIHTALTGQPVEPDNFTRSLVLSLLVGALVGVFFLVLCMIILSIGGSALRAESGIQIAMMTFPVGTMLGGTSCIYLLWRGTPS